MQPLDLVGIFIRPLETADIKYLVTGSVASIAYGEPRLTHDIDLLLQISSFDIQRFSALFPPESFYCPPEEIIRIELNRRPFSHFNLIHHDSGLKADCYPFTGDPLEAWAFGNRRRLSLSESIDLWVAPVEYVIIRKIQYFQEGGSQKHLNDIRAMITLSAGSIDRVFLRNTLEDMSLAKSWDSSFPGLL